MSSIHVKVDGEWSLPDNPKTALLQISIWLKAMSAAAENCSNDFGAPDYFKLKIPVEFAYDIQGYAHEAERIAVAEVGQ